MDRQIKPNRQHQQLNAKEASGKADWTRERFTKTFWPSKGKSAAIHILNTNRRPKGITKTRGKSCSQFNISWQNSFKITEGKRNDGEK